MFGTSDIGIGSAVMYSVLGMAIVFLMLIFLWAIVELMASAIKKDEAKLAAAAAPAPNVPAPAQVSVPIASSISASKATAPTIQSNSEVVNDRDAAMLMAIVAYNMKKPLRELRFKSIREVEDDEV